MPISGRSRGPRPVTARDRLPISPLRVRRLPLSGDLRLADAGSAPFGALAYGDANIGDWLSGVDAQVLSPGGPVADVWQAGNDVAIGTTGAAHWRSDGQWAIGRIDLDESAEGQTLEILAQRAYQDLFQALKDTDCPHLLRIWNYLPRINADGGGLERYRQFNLGRQKAFLDAGQAAFDGAPAACALGIRQGALGIRFLAGQRAPVPIENPRQVSAYRYPSAYGPRAPTFSRAALAELGGGSIALFISGTASIVGHESVHVGDVAAQTQETLRNLAAVIDAARQRTDAPFDVAALDAVVYVRHAADASVVRSVLQAELGAASQTVREAVFLEADVCRQDLLVEIEAHAVAAGRLNA
ncbi:pteridine-dependent deoxygenase [soil metagenome]